MAHIAVLGAGAIGATVGGWLAEAGHDVTFIARGETAAALARDGLTLYRAVEHRHSTRPVRVVEDITQAPAPDLLVVAVKNYDLDAVARAVRARLAGEPVVIALQNGLDNQAVLPRYFARVIYGVVCYNAWRKAPAVVGYEARGPILLGVLDTALLPVRDEAVRVFAAGCRCSAEPRLVDAVKCKMLLNLANSITALVGLGLTEVDDYDALRRAMLSVWCEGIDLLQRDGVREVKLAQAPGWRGLKTLHALPGWITTPILRRKLRQVHLSSMAQDVYLAHRHETELESLNGWFVRLADALGAEARYNRALYALTRAWLARGEPRPLGARELWQQLQRAA